MIKSIVFDMGQVLIKFDPKYFIERIGITDPEDTKLLLRNVYQSLEWARMDRGSLNEESACEIMKTHVPEHLRDAVRLLTADWCRPIIPIDGMPEMVRELKQNGYRLYLLSNASLMQKSYWPQIPGSELFDGRIVSSEVGFVKPQPEIYRILLDTYSLNPDECVFIDDATINIEGAYQCGLHTIVFHGDPLEVREKLAEMGVNISVG